MTKNCNLYVIEFLKYYDINDNQLAFEICFWYTTS